MPKKIKARSTSKQDGPLKLDTYIHKILKQIRPELGISTKAIQQVNGVLVGQLEKMTDPRRRRAPWTATCTTLAAAPSTALSWLTDRWPDRRAADHHGAICWQNDRAASCDATGW